MSTNQEILNLLEKHQIKDDFLAENYENISAQKRALIKTAIAFQFSFHKKKSEEEKYFSNRHSGFFYGIHEKPAPFLVCVLEQEFTSPAKLLSILCPAVIAGVENIYIFLSPHMADSVLASLELSGIENAYLLKDNSSATKTAENISVIGTCLEHLLTEFPHEKGRVILLSNEKTKQSKTDELENNFFEQLEEKTKTLSIPTYIDVQSPTIYARKENHALINFAYTDPNIIDSSMHIAKCAQHEKTPCSEHMPEAVPNTAAANNTHNNPKNDFAKQRNNASASFTTNNQPIADISFIPELLGMQNYSEGMELCFIHEFINIDFFVNKKISAQMPQLDAQLNATPLPE